MWAAFHTALFATVFDPKHIKLDPQRLFAAAYRCAKFSSSVQLYLTVLMPIHAGGSPITPSQAFLRPGLA
eukprot:scaffold650904_cov51-Prasinocladus_malaysianus.AAC.1